MAEYDSLIPYAKDVEHYTDQTDWTTLFSIKFRSDLYDDLKLWAELKRVGGSGDVSIRIQVTDGSTYNSTGVSTSNTDWTEVTDTLDISGIANQVWTINVQGKVGTAGEMYCQGIYLQRYKA